MDLFEATSSMRNSVGQDCDKEKNKSNKNTRCPQGGGDNCNVVFTPISNSTEYNSAQNGPRPRNINSVSSSESRQSSKQSDINSDSRNCEATSSQACGTVSSSSAEPDSSQSHRDSNCDNGIDTHEVQCQRRQVTDNINVNNQPSTSGTNKSSEADSSSCRENRKRPSTLKLNRSDYVESSSDTGDDDYSLGSEDGCIYTYRGGEHLADLPSSFFSLDMGLPLDKHLPMLPNYPVPPQPLPARGDSRASSPDMDFIEMDFDPGPSCEVDTGDESTPDADVEAAGIMPEDDEPPLVIRGTSPEYLAAARPSNPIPAPSCRVDQEVPSTSRAITVISSAPEEPEKDNVFYGPYITHVNARGEEILVRRTMSIGVYREPLSLHISSGDLVSPKEMSIYDEDQAEKEQPFGHQINQGPQFDSANLSSALYHITMAKKLIGLAEQAKSSDHLDSSDMTSQATPAVASTSASCGAAGDTGASACVEPPRCMVWSEREACERQVTQIGTSACGATAVVNVFIALGVPINTERINASVGTRQRANNAPLPRYLLTRAVAGCTAADLVSGIQRASDGLVTARFFPTYPERAVSLSHWLADWISLGAVPILTLNLQVGCEGEIPDAWHHQMVFGVSSRGVYLCNPVECVRETALWQRLTSPSVLLVRARDVLSRFTANTDLTPLMVVPDRRFHTFNVLGQVVNVIREWRATGWSEHGTRTRHIRLPAAYQAGVTIAALTGSEAHRRLMHAPQLPILAAETEADKSR